VANTVKLRTGDSRRTSEGHTLVVDVANDNDETWFEVVGSFHSDALHVAERFTPVSADMGAQIRATEGVLDPRDPRAAR
jgi:hypothetical protein